MGFTHVELMPVAGAPLRRLVGLSGHRLLRADQPVRHARGLHAPWSTRSTGRGIGVILDWVPAHFPNDPHGLGDFDGTHLYEHADPLQAGPSGLEHLHLRLRPPRGGQLPDQQRPLLARQVPRRRPAGGRGRLDALPRLLAEAGRVDAQRVRRAREPGGDPLPPAVQRAGPRRVPRRPDDRRGVDRLADGLAAHERRRPGVRPQVGPRLDARHARLPGPRPDLSASTTTTG